MSDAAPRPDIMTLPLGEIPGGDRAPPRSDLYGGFYAWLDAGGGRVVHAVELGVVGRPVVPTRTLCRVWKDMGRDDWLETIVPDKPRCRACLKEWQLVHDSRWKPLEAIRKGWVCLSDSGEWCGQIHARQALAEGHAMRAPGWRIRKLTGDELRELVAADDGSGL